MNTFKLDDFKFFCFKPNHIEASQITNYNKAYELYNQVWQESLSAIYKNNFQLYSDDFLKQDEILCLFFQDQCIALNFHRKINLQLIAERKQKWLSIWPKEILQELSQKYESINISAGFSVHPDYRKQNLNSKIEIAFLQGCLSLLKLLDDNCQLSLGSMRKARKMHELAALWGADIQIQDLIYNQEPTDLVIFDMQTIKTKSADYPLYAHQIFQNYKQQSQEKDVSNETLVNF